MIADALARLVARARARGCGVQLAPAAENVPEVVAGAPLDPDLRELLRRHDGVRIHGDAFALFVYGFGGVETIAWSTAGLRSLASEVRYPFDELVSFAQVGYQASYLCCVPALAAADGHQPVLYVDTHEEPWAMPVASSVERAFDALARNLEHGDRVFPREALASLRADAELVALARSGAFDAWVAAERAWLDALVA